MTIKAVFFDMGGTIQTFRHSPELGLQATPGLRTRLQAAGIDLPLEDRQLYQLVSTGLNRYRQWSLQTLEERCPLHVWRAYVFAGTDMDLNRLDPIAEDLMLYVETHFYQRHMRPEMPAVLQAIQTMGLKIGLISNVCSRGQVPTNLDEYGLRAYFDPIVLSSQYGRRKPDPAIFHYAARLAQVPTSQCVYIGDRISRDILGARRAGFRLAIQIHHDFHHGEAEQGPQPDATITHMYQLIEILQAERDQSGEGTLAPGADPQPPRAILFDAGGILYYRPNKGRKLEAFLKGLNLQAVDNHSARKQALVRQAYQGKIDLEQYRRAVLHSLGVLQPADLARGLRILEQEDDEVHFFPGIRQTLEALKDQGYLLGIITDTANPVYLKLQWFERGGFGHVWDAIISSKEVGVRKPAPAIYQAALRQLGVSPCQAVFVGHKASELDGARAVGLATVAFNPDQGAWADETIDEFCGLLTSSIVGTYSPIEKTSVFHGDHPGDSL